MNPVCRTASCHLMRTSERIQIKYFFLCPWKKCEKQLCPQSVINRLCFVTILQIVFTLCCIKKRFPSCYVTFYITLEHYREKKNDTGEPTHNWYIHPLYAELYAAHSLYDTISSHLHLKDVPEGWHWEHKCSHWIFTEIFPLDLGRKSSRDH